MQKKVILIILDGWGIATDPKVSAIDQANTPFIDSLYDEYPHCKLNTSGLAVGLPAGQMGNSEVGHMNIGAGKVVYQDLVKINKAVEEGTLANEPALVEALEYARLRNKKVHFIGLVSDGGVHSHIDHLKGLCRIAYQRGITNFFVHAFTDGRDTDPKSGLGYLTQLQTTLAQTGGKIASVIGRYYAMDRDYRWERVKLAYDAMVHGAGKLVEDVLTAVQQSYEAGVTDEFIKPIIATGAGQQPVALIEEGDVVLCFNFRTDRGREITQALTQTIKPKEKYYAILSNQNVVEVGYETIIKYYSTIGEASAATDVAPSIHDNKLYNEMLSSPTFASLSSHEDTLVAETTKTNLARFVRESISGNLKILTEKDFLALMPKLNLYYVTMTNYDDKFENVHVIFDKDNLQNTLGEVLAKVGKKQIRIAETEKYPHVTFFFSGGRENPFEGESRLMCPSPKVATYDLKPEMSAFEIRDAIIPELKKGEADFVCLNFANADMVGHTGVFEAAIKACETVDQCTEAVTKAALANGYMALIIADHGNSDCLINPDGSPNTAHTTNPVPSISWRQEGCMDPFVRLDAVAARMGRPDVWGRLGARILGLCAAVVGAGFLLAASLAPTASLAAAAVDTVSRDLLTFEPLPASIGEPQERSVVLARDGKLMAVLHDVENRKLCILVDNGYMANSGWQARRHCPHHSGTDGNTEAYRK